jgi:hypothetical protein
MPLQPQRLSEGTAVRRTPEHGSRRGYTENGCRCEACRKWNSDRCRDYQGRRKLGIQLQRPKGSGPEHGTPSAYSHHGCRCQTCVDAHNARNRAEYERNKESHRRKQARYRKSEKGLLHYRLAQQVTRRKMPKTAESKVYATLLLSDPCSYCNGAGGVIEHIQSDQDGEWWNLTAACASCNARKRSRSLVEFLLYMQKR